MNALIRYLKGDTLLESSILGMSFEDAYETVFSKLTDMLFETQDMDSVNITHIAQDATQEYLDEIHFEEMNDPELVEKTKQLATDTSILARHMDAFTIYNIVREHPEEDVDSLKNRVKIAYENMHESKEPVLVKKFFEAIGDLPAGYTEDEAADLFEMHANDPEFEIDDSDDYVTDDQKAKMAQFIAVHGAPDYNGHQWFITLHGEDAENFGDDDFEEAADLGIKIDYSYDTVTLTFPCCGYEDVYPEMSPSSPYEGRNDDYEEIV